MLKAYNPPHIRGRDSNKTMMDDVLIVLAAIRKKKRESMY